MDFSGYLSLSDGSSWSPTEQYYRKLISRLVKGEAASTEENIHHYNNLLLIFPSLLLFLKVFNRSACWLRCVTGGSVSSQVPCLSSSTPPLWSCWPYPHQEERLPKHSLRPSTSGVHIVRAGSYMVDFPLLPPQGCLVSGGGGGRGLTLDECPGPPLHLTSCEQTGSSPNIAYF